MAKKIQIPLDVESTAAMYKAKQITAALDKAGRTGAASGKTVEAGMMKGVKSAAVLAAGLIGVGSAAAGIMAIVNQLKAEYQHLKDQQAAAAAAQRSVGEARAMALLNLPNDMSFKRQDAFVNSLASETKVGRSALWNMMGGLLSAKGAVSESSMQQAARLSARIASKAGSSFDMGTTAGGIMDVMRATGLKDADQAFGWLRTVGTSVRVVDPQKQVRSLVPVISGAEGFGFQQESAAELMAYLTMAGGDTMGRLSATGAINIMGLQTKARTKSGSYFSGGQRLTKTGLAGIAEAQGIFASLSPEDQLQTAANLPLSAKVKPLFLSLLRGDERAMATFGRAQEAIPSPYDGGNAATAEEYFRTVKKLEPKSSAVSKTFESATETAKLINEAGGTAGATRVGLEKALRSVPGISDMHVKWAMLRFDKDVLLNEDDPVQVAIGTIKAVKEQFGFGHKYYKVRSVRDGLSTTLEREWTDTEPGFWANGGKNRNYAPGQGENIDALINSLESMDQKAPPGEPVSMGGSTINIGAVYSNTPQEQAMWRTGRGGGVNYG